MRKQKSTLTPVFCLSSKSINLSLPDQFAIMPPPSACCPPLSLSVTKLLNILQSYTRNRLFHIVNYCHSFLIDHRITKWLSMDQVDKTLEVHYKKMYFHKSTFEIDLQHVCTLVIYSNGFYLLIIEETYHVMRQYVCWFCLLVNVQCKLM